MEGELAGQQVQRQTAQRHVAPVETFRRLDRPAKAAIALLAANVVLDLAAVVTDMQMVGLVNRAQAGELVTFEEADALDVRMARIGLLQLVGVLIAAIPFLVWFRRAYRNLGALGVRLLRFKPGWAVGSWFVPILGLFRPKAIANDIWRATDPALAAEIEEPPPWGRVSPLLTFWWIAYLVSGFLYGMGSSIDERATIDEILSQAQRYAVADTISVIAGILAIMVVRRITDRMHQRAVMVSEGAAASPPEVLPHADR
ncbi:MAG TPA: DUF4328 domain-containing protein [Actinomycetota bacterium]|nr:DUF4328 domain-containing protein [Actinomycetota bacterium]